MTNGNPGPEARRSQAPGRTPGEDTIICLSEGDFCLSFSNFSSCLISLFRIYLHFLISA